ncbi:hypothetical protein AV521_01715 [Streptomyces sp. IMTB 2501]|nr:hypothetical protein AV521_01715 [Streptomyces sp. IMTB 2501]
MCLGGRVLSGETSGAFSAYRRLHRAWPGSELVVVEGAGHLGSATTRDHVLQALDPFASVN